MSVKGLNYIHESNLHIRKTKQNKRKSIKRYPNIGEKVKKKKKGQEKQQTKKDKNKQKHNKIHRSTLKSLILI